MEFKVTQEVVIEAESADVARDQCHAAFSALVPAFPNWRQIQTTGIEELPAPDDAGKITRHG